MGPHRRYLTIALFAASCAAPVRVDEADWRQRVRGISAPPPAEAIDASAPVGLPPTLQGPLLVKSFLRYDLSRGEDIWDIRFQGPERSVQRVDSWASVTLTSPGNQRSAMVKAARVYSGRINIARRGEETDDALLLLPLAFMGDSLYQACVALGPMGIDEFKQAEDAKEIGEAYVGGFLAGFAASFTVQRTSEIAGLMSSVMQWPSGWLGKDHDATVTLRPDALSAEACSTAFGPGWRLPLEVLAGANQAFVGEVTVVEPQGALNLAAGVVEVSGFSPDRPDEVIRLRLIGAHAPRTDHLTPDAVEKLLEIKPRSKTTVASRF